MKKVKLKLELQYNSPVILTFFLLSLLVLFLDQWTDGWTTMHLFCVYRSSLKDPLFYIRLFGHVLGHASWDHFLNNMLLLLVVGPPMEEKYGSKPLLCGMVFTALVTGVLQCVLFPRSGLLGASGIVFMLIMLSSLAGFSGGIPVTMLLVAALYFGQQVYDIIFVHDNVANFMHIVGGLCGTAFGYYSALHSRRRPAKVSQTRSRGRPKRTRPEMSPAAVRALFTPLRYTSSISSHARANSSPAAVSATVRVLRSTSLRFSSLSSAAMLLLRAGWVMYSCFAA